MKKTGSRRGIGASPEKSTPMGCPMSNHNHTNIHTIDIIMTEQALFRNIYMHVLIVIKGAIDLKEIRNGYIGGFVRKKDMEKTLKLY